MQPKQSKDKNGDEVTGSSVSDGAENAPATKKCRVAKTVCLNDLSWDEYEDDDDEEEEEEYDDDEE
jgi:hypothetical protein